MAYLQDLEYFGFIENAIKLKSGSLEQYFYSLYKTHKEDNLDFIARLGQLINELKDKLENAKQEGIANKSRIEMESKGMVMTDFANTYDWDNHRFYFQRGQVFYHCFDTNAINFSFLDKFNLIEGWLKLEQMCEKDNIEKPKSKEHSIKLNWTLQKNQLYYVFRQLKNEHSAISMSYDDIAEFIKENIVGFETTKKGTIEKELKKDLDDTLNFPKNKRIKVKIEKVK
jgi:hypothetical protein